MNPSDDIEERTIGDLLDVRDSDLILIHDAWTGYNEHSPIAAVWDLRRAAPGDFVGQGRFSTALAGERVVDVTLAAAKAKKFLAAVAGARVLRGPYDPLMEHTDDFPHMEVALHAGARNMMTPGGVALLFTTSQGEFHAPWGAFVGGQVLTIPGEEVGRALAALRVPLKRRTLDQMMKETDEGRSGR